MQVKNLKKARKLAKAINTIEEECGIHSVKIEFRDFFVCPWINFKKMDKTEMERLVRDLLTRPYDDD